MKKYKFLLLMGVLILSNPVSVYRNVYAETVESSENVEAVKTGDDLPVSMAWSGGSGRLKGMRCDRIWNENNQIWGEIVIESENYLYIKVDEVQYDRVELRGKESVFEIPISLEEEMEILACTNAMSTEHEIAYQIYISTQEQSETSSELSEELTEEEDWLLENVNEDKESDQFVNEEQIPQIEDHAYKNRMDLDFANGFDVYYYEDGYKVLDVHNDRQYLLVPEDGNVPEGLPDEIVILQQPVDQIYLGATAVMSLFDCIDALDAIRLSSVQSTGWYIENAIQAMEEGKIVFAGKYSEPDYEKLVSENCNLAIESTMILHTPKVQEMIESMGIPVFIDRSSYEEHPLGRTEWVRLYGALLNKEELADEFFEKQARVIDQLADFTNTEKTVAFFYIGSDGSVVVRNPEDYVPKMIEIAGGRYIFNHINEEQTKKSSVNMTMEEFYVTALDADYLVYNATIDAPIHSLEELLQKEALLADFKAVQEGNVWCAGKYLYQATDIVGNMITDFHLMLTDGDENDMTFMTRIQ